jgi:hypothetical protein
MTTAISVIVNTRSRHPPPSTESPIGTRQDAEGCPIAGLASLVDDVVSRLEAPAADEPADGLISGCTAALEACLERLRDAGGRDNLVRTAKVDLQRLARLLKLVDGPDVPFVLRQIRRVLGRFDACGGGLAVNGDG